MAYYERTYYQDPQGSPFGRKSVVQILIIINVVVFLIDSIMVGSLRGSNLAPQFWGSYSAEKAIFGFQVWRVFTYQFLHGDFFHILFNMLWLYFLGRYVENSLGSRRFIAFYLLCGVSGALFTSLFAFNPGLIGMSVESTLVGASGSVFGILVAAAVLFPHQPISLFGVFNMTMRTLALVALGIAVFSMLAGSINAGGEAAHLAGGVAGFVLIRNQRWLQWADRFGGKRLSVTDLQEKVNRAKFQKKRASQAKREQKVDHILDKISKHGMQSLTRKEKKILQQESESKRE